MLVTTQSVKWKKEKRVRRGNNKFLSVGLQTAACRGRGFVCVPLSVCVCVRRLVCVSVCEDVPVCPSS